MKYIFDFDDVLFNNTAQFKKHMYLCLENIGVSNERAEEYYKEVRAKGFSIKNFLAKVVASECVDRVDEEELYEKIMSESKNFINTELVELVRNLGKENCFIVTHGVEEYQLDKITRTEIGPMFSEIIVVQESKKQSIELICAKYKNEDVLFIDDKIKRFEDLDLVKFPNLKPVLFNEQGLEKLKAELLTI